MISRRVFVAIAHALVAVALLVPVSGSGATVCASYSVTAPKVGTQSGGQCGPQLPPEFDQWVSVNDCEQFPWLGIARCIYVFMPTP